MVFFDTTTYADLEEEVFCGDSFTEVTKETIYETSRWRNYYRQVFKYDLDGTFWEASWARGSTEYQDEGIEDFSLVQVEPKEVTTTIYEMVK